MRKLPHSFRASPVRKFRLRRPLLAVGALATLVAGCLPTTDATNPTQAEILALNWGATMVPQLSDLPYVAGARLCPGPGSDYACGGSQTLDVYRRQSGTPRGTVVFVHGGGFNGGDKTEMNFEGVVRRTTHLGWDLVSVNYRLVVNGVKDTFPAGMQDVAAALRWLRANGPKYGLTTNRLVVTGHSAGGTLAALAGTAGNSGRAEFAGIPPLSGWVSWAGILDFASGPNSIYIADLWMADPANQSRIASPKTWWDPADPGGYVVHGVDDNVVEYANLTRMRAVTGAGPVRYDTVDVFADGTPLGLWGRGHGPQEGMNVPAFDAWMVERPALDRFANPFGNFESASPSTGSTTVSGWAIDPDTTAPVVVHAYLDGRFSASGTASVARTDVGAVHPVYGTAHGFRFQVPATAGSHQVCVYAINAFYGTTNPLLGCRAVTVS